MYSAQQCCYQNLFLSDEFSTLFIYLGNPQESMLTYGLILHFDAPHVFLCFFVIAGLVSLVQSEHINEVVM